jgi:hypothetical protein
VLGQRDGQLVHLHVGRTGEHQDAGFRVAVARVDEVESVYALLEVQGGDGRAEDVLLALKE